MNDDFWSLGDLDGSRDVIDVDADDKGKDKGKDASKSSDIAVNKPVRSSAPAVNEPEFQDLSSVLSELPQDVIDSMPTIQNRINAYITYYSAMNLMRLPKLLGFIRAAEEVLFNPSDIMTMDSDQVQTIYSTARRSIDDAIDSARKVSQSIQQERDKQVDALYSLLTGLSPSTVERMMEMANAAVEEEKNKAHGKFGSDDTESK